MRVYRIALHVDLVKDYQQNELRWLLHLTEVIVPLQQGLFVTPKLMSFSEDLMHMLMQASCLRATQPQVLQELVHLLLRDDLIAPVSHPINVIAHA